MKYFSLPPRYALDTLLKQRDLQPTSSPEATRKEKPKKNKEKHKTKREHKHKKEKVIYLSKIDSLISWLKLKTEEKKLSYAEFFFSVHSFVVHRVCNKQSFLYQTLCTELHVKMIGPKYV